MRVRLSDRLLGASPREGNRPLWLVTEALVVSCVGTAIVVCAGLLAVLSGFSAYLSTAAVTVGVAAVVLYLLITRAGHLLVAGVAVLGALLASYGPGAATEVWLSGVGRTQDVVVTLVAYEPVPSGARGGPAYYCSVRRQDGSPVETRLWRGCGPSVAPGDMLGMLYDPAGRVPPRGVEGHQELLRSVGRTVPLLLAFAVLCFVAVVRSYRVPSALSSG